MFNLFSGCEILFRVSQNLQFLLPCFFFGMLWGSLCLGIWSELLFALYLVRIPMLQVHSPQNPRGSSLVVSSLMISPRTSSFSGILRKAFFFCIKQSSVFLDYMPVLVLCSCVLFMSLVIAFLFRYDFLIDFTGSCFEKELGKHEPVIIVCSLFGLSLFIFVAISDCRISRDW